MATCNLTCKVPELQDILISREAFKALTCYKSFQNAGSGGTPVISLTKYAAIRNNINIAITPNTLNLCGGDIHNLVAMFGTKTNIIIYKPRVTPKHNNKNIFQSNHMLTFLLAR